MLSACLAGKAHYRRLFRAYSGREGVDICCREIPDLVVLDLLMPTMNGFDVIAALAARSETASIPVVVVTGKSLNSEDRRLLQGAVWLPPQEIRMTNRPRCDCWFGGNQKGRATIVKAATILVVEDAPANIKLVTMLLEKDGYRVLQAETGTEGVKLAQLHIPDLILMDIQLPDMDGLTAVKLLKQDQVTRHIKMVALTAFAMKGDERKNAGQRLRWLYCQTDTLPKFS